MKQAATRIEDQEYELFQKTAANIGTTTADVLRMFIYAFNDHHGFPYPVQSRRMQTRVRIGATAAKGVRTTVSVNVR